MAYDGVALGTDTTLDLWKLTLSNYGWDEKGFTMLFGKHTFFMLDQTFGPDKIESEGGTQIVRDVIYRDGGSAQWVQPGAVREVGTLDIITQVTVPFVNVVDNFSITEAELRRNRGRAKLKNLQASRRLACKVRLATGIDERMLQAPTSSTDKIHPYGLPYWAVKITGTQAATAAYAQGKHQGENPSGFSTTGGIDASDSTYSRWRNYCAAWTNTDGDITEDDLLRVGQMHRNLRWQVPRILADLATPAFKKLSIITNQEILNSVGKATRRLNDQIGWDAMKGYGIGYGDMGNPTFGGIPLMWADYLENDTDNPLYMVNHDHLYPVIEEGCWFRELPAMRQPAQPDTFVSHVDCGFNLLCRDRQKAVGVISNATS